MGPEPHQWPALRRAPWPGRAPTTVDVTTVVFEFATLAAVGVLVFVPRLGRTWSRGAVALASVVPVMVLVFSASALSSPGALDHGHVAGAGETGGPHLHTDGTGASAPTVTPVAAAAEAPLDAAGTEELDDELARVRRSLRSSQLSPTPRRPECTTRRHPEAAHPGTSWHPSTSGSRRTPASISSTRSSSYTWAVTPGRPWSAWRITNSRSTARRGSWDRPTRGVYSAGCAACPRLVEGAGSCRSTATWAGTSAQPSTAPTRTRCSGRCTPGLPQGGKTQKASSASRTHEWPAWSTCTCDGPILPEGPVWLPGPEATEVLTADLAACSPGSPTDP